jgi:hypothetical protein
MSDADLQVVDSDIGDPLEFDLGAYRHQLVAGYSQTTPAMGLYVHMPDANEATPVMGGDVDLRPRDRPTDGVRRPRR